MLNPDVADSPGLQHHSDGLVIKVRRLLSCVGTSDDSGGDPTPLPWTTAWVVQVAARCVKCQYRCAQTRGGGGRR